VLEPVLFILFVNDIVCCMADIVSVKLFADNAKIYTFIDSVNFNSSQMQYILDLVASWAVHWQLKLLPTKCSVMQTANSLSCPYLYSSALYRLPRSARI